MPYLGQSPSKGDENNFKILDDISSYTLTFDGSDSSVVSAANDTITSLTHRFVQGQRVTYNKGGGTVITGLSDGVYYIIKEDHNTIKLATSASNAANGIAVNITNVGSGSSHTLNVAFDGVNTKFKATHTTGQKAKITRSAQLVISMNGVIQQPHDTATPSTGFGFDLDGTIVFSQAPVSSDVFWAHVLTNNNVTFDISDNDIDNFTGDGSTVSFNLSKTPPDNRNILVTIDGVVQYPNDPDGTERSYNVVENVLTFSVAPALGTEVQVRHIGFAGSSSGSGSGGVTSFYGRTGAVVLKNTDNIVANNATFSGDLTVNGTTTTLDTKLVEVDKIEVEAGGTNVAVAVTQSGSGDILRLYDGAAQLFTVADGGNVTIKNITGTPNFNIQGTNASATAESNINFLLRDGNSADRTIAKLIARNTGNGGYGALDFYTAFNNTNFRRMSIHHNGNVGIGSTIPSEKLDVIGNIKATGTLTASSARFEDNGTSNNPIVSVMADDHNPYAFQVGNSTYSTNLMRGHLLFVMNDGDVYHDFGSDTSAYTDVFFRLRNSSATFKTCISFEKSDQSVELYAEGSKRLETNSSGINITGIATVSTRLNINTVSNTELAVAGTNTPWRGMFMIKDTTTGATAMPYMTFWDGNEVNDNSNTGLLGRAGHVNGGATNERFDFWTYRSTTPLSLGTNGNERLRITPAGQVLIVSHGGNAISARTLLSNYTPSFQIEGNSKSTTSASLTANVNNTVGPSLWFAKTRGTAISGSNTAVHDDDELGTIVFNGADGTDIQTMGAYIRGAVDGSVSSNDVPSRLQFHTATGGTMYERVRITSGGSVRIDGATSSLHGLRFTPNGWNSYDNRMGYCGTSGGDFWWSSNWSPANTNRDHSGYATNYIRQNVQTGYLSFGTGGINESADERLRITNGGSVGIGSIIYHLGDDDTNFGFPSDNSYQVKVAGESRIYTHPSEAIWNRRDANAGITTQTMLINYNTAAGTGCAIGFAPSGVNYNQRHSSIEVVNEGNNQMTMRFKVTDPSVNDHALERMRITHEGKVLIGTQSSLSFNGVGQNHNLIVAGNSNDQDITDNYNAAITISNQDNTANNTAGLHFAREDTDGNPHYDGASIVAQFLESMNTGQYPKADLAFLTATANNNAPSEKMRLKADGNVKAIIGAFDSRWGYTVDVSIDTSNWGQNTFYRVVNDNVFDSSNDTYLVWFKWSHGGSGAPWLITGNFLFTPTGANTTGAVSGTFTPVQVAHNSASTISFRGEAGGNVRPGLSAKADSWDPSGGTLYIKASKIGHPFA